MARGTAHHLIGGPARDRAATPILVAKSRRLAQLHAHLAFAYWPRCRELGLLAV
jgi:hypothetical protein